MLKTFTHIESKETREPVINIMKKGTRRKLLGNTSSDKRGIYFAHQCHSERLLPITPRTPCLLKILFRRRGQHPVDYRTHIRLVNPHPKSVRGHHHTHLAFHPSTLTLATLRMRQPCMKGVSSDSGEFQKFRQLLRSFPITTIDDRSSRHAREDT